MDLRITAGDRVLFSGSEDDARMLFDVLDKRFGVTERARQTERVLLRERAPTGCPWSTSGTLTEADRRKAARFDALWEGRKP